MLGPYGSGIDKDRQDYTVYTGGWDIGRIYEVRGGPENLRWFWSFALHGPMTRSDRAATLEEAKAQFQKSWNVAAVSRQVYLALFLDRRSSDLNAMSR
jgi:hypothetical protein